MTETQVRYTDQRGTDTLITQHEVDRAWADSVGTCDMFERNPSDYTRRRMLEATEYAEKLQNLYYEQQDELEAQQVTEYLAAHKDPEAVADLNAQTIDEGKRVMMTSVNGQVKVDPAWCKHSDTQWVTSGGYFTTQGEADDDVLERLICKDCGADVTPEDKPNPDIKAIEW